MTEGQRLIRIGIAIFLVACVVLFALGFLVAPRNKAVARFAPTPAAVPAPDGTFTATLDFRDETTWTGFDFGTGKLAPDAEASDLAGKRHILRAPRGIVDLGVVPLAQATAGPDTAWISDEHHGDTTENVALRHWYHYAYWTHILHAQPNVYAVPRAGGGHAYFRIDSYYCAPEGAGCLTITYRLD